MTTCPDPPPNEEVPAERQVMEYDELKKWAEEHLTVDGEPLVLPGMCKLLWQLFANWPSEPPGNPRPQRPALRLSVLQGPGLRMTRKDQQMYRGNKLRQWRLERQPRLTLRQVAKMVGLSFPTAARHETGRTERGLAKGHPNPRPSTIEAYMQLYGKSYAEVLHELRLLPHEFEPSSRQENRRDNEYTENDTVAAPATGD